MEISVPTMLNMTPSGKLRKNSCKVDLAALILEPAIEPDLGHYFFKIPLLYLSTTNTSSLAGMTKSLSILSQVGKKFNMKAIELSEIST